MEISPVIDKEQFDALVKDISTDMHEGKIVITSVTRENGMKEGEPIDGWARRELNGKVKLTIEYELKG